MPIITKHGYFSALVAIAFVSAAGGARSTGCGEAGMTGEKASCGDLRESGVLQAPALQRRPSAATIIEIPSPAPRSCVETVGAVRAKELATQCGSISPAAHPPCHVENPCATIVDEIKRGCALWRQSGKTPAFCDAKAAAAPGSAAGGAQTQVSAPSHGKWPERLTLADKARLDAFQATRAQAVSEARASQSKEDVAALEQALGGKELSVHDGFDPTGEWRCRTMKLGKLLPLTVYPWFRCRISDDGAGWRLDKLSGSQRTSGRFYDMSDARMVYLGALFYNDDPPVAYGAAAERDQVAIVVRPGTNRLRLEFPSPVHESLFDILELERAAR